MGAPKGKKLKTNHGKLAGIFCKKLKKMPIRVVNKPKCLSVTADLTMYQIKASFGKLSRFRSQKLQKQLLGKTGFFQSRGAANNRYYVLHL